MAQIVAISEKLISYEYNLRLKLWNYSLLADFQDQVKVSP